MPEPRLTRRTVIVGGLAAATAASSFDLRPAKSKKPMDLSLWYDQPAKEWTEALPLGNGRIGAMVFGDPKTEHYQLNEATLWAGGPHDYTNPEALSVLPEIRRLVFEGKFKEAQKLADGHFMSRPLGQLQYQTLGDLHLEFPGFSEATDYRRELDLDTAIHRVSYRLNGKEHVRESFVSYPDQVLVIRLTGGLRPVAALSSPHSIERVLGGLQGIGGDSNGVKGQVRFAALVKAIPDGDATTLLVSLATSYRNYEDVSGDPIALANAYLDKAAHKSYDELKKAHIRDHQKLFRRVALNLGVTPDGFPTDERIRKFRSGAADPALAALYFQYGRYLLIAASRPGGQAATLQGLWNDSVSPPWGSKYTVNINTEMNYWPTETCNLSECHEPLFNMLSEVAKTGSHTAKVHYGARGWVLHHNTDGWRGAAPIDGAAWGIWPTGGAWLCTHLYQHYLFTRDKEALRRHYPLMKGAAEFFFDTLTAHPTKGWLVTCPSTSPENSHHPGEGLCAGPTMDMAILRDLFDACADAAKELNIDADFREEVLKARAALAPLQIGAQGQLQEWLDDWDATAPEQHHRHVSHLYALFPGSEISPKTPELFAAAKRSLELRGDAGTGWSLAWKLNLWARLLDGDHCYGLVKEALKPVGQGGGGVYPNLFDAHPPFQIDGNFGFASGLAEMFLQSQHGDLHLLPALPSAWPKGEIRGLRARGGHQVDLAWKDGKLASAKIVPGQTGPLHLQYLDREIAVEVQAGHAISVTPKSFG